jgi:CelD/BcsL family acetyltransferase involved in cellulose biosynthesis
MFKILALSKTSELRAHIAEWEALAREASEDNPFYEHWMLLPAIECLGEASGVEVLFVYQETKLVALFPLQKVNKIRGVPLPHYRLWFHRHCYLSSPLIRRGQESEALQALFDWLKSKRRAALAWNWAGADGPIFTAFEALSQRHGWVVYRSGYERAVLRDRAGGEGYITATISGRHRRDFTRLEKRLAETDEVSYRLADGQMETQAWLEKFFELEASGWKGREGTAMKCDPGDREFMARIVESARALGKARLSLLSAGDTALAAKCEFVTNKSCFSFKVGFDEKYAKSRPGILLEFWLLRQMGQLDCKLFDSCSQPGSMFERIWVDRRKIATLLVATRVFPEGLILRAIPHAKQIVEKLRALKSRQTPAQDPEGAPAEPPSA